MNPLAGRLGAAIAVAGVAAATTWTVANPPADHMGTGGPAAWIDDPLDGTELPANVEEVGVVAHATDPDGIVELVLSVDGQAVNTVETSGEELVDAELAWRPPGAGTYQLVVVGRDPSGAATRPGRASVQIGSGADRPTTTQPSDEVAEGPATTSAGEPAGGETTTSTDVPGGPATTQGPVTSAVPTTTTPGPATTATNTTATNTTAPSTTTPTTSPRTTTTQPTTTTTQPTTTTTSTTTTPPCSPGMPVNVSPAHGTSVGSRTPTLAWEYRGCGPEQFQVLVTPSVEFAPVEAAGTVDGSARSWTTPTLACGTHWFRVRAVSGSLTGPWSAATSFEVFARVC